jgi:hypothetical protein
MPIAWMRSADLYPDAGYPPTDFVAFDGEEIIGRVYRIRHGTEQGLWFWSMTVSLPGPAFNARSGTEAHRGEAGRRVIEAYQRMLARVRKAPHGFR